MFLGYQNGKIKFYVEQPLNPQLYNVDRWEQTDKEYVLEGDEYVIKDEEWERREEEKERERIAKLHLTRGDVFRALLLAKQVTRAQLRQVIENLPEETNEQSVAKEMALIDFDEALDFYRGVALIDTVGAQLGITPKQMDRFFETNDWRELLVVESEENSEE